MENGAGAGGTKFQRHVWHTPSEPVAKQVFTRGGQADPPGPTPGVQKPTQQKGIHSQVIRRCFLFICYTRASRSLLTPPNESGPAYSINPGIPRCSERIRDAWPHECASIPTTSATIYDEFSFELRRPGTLPPFPP